MDLPRVFVITCNQYLWAMEPFAYLFNKYWGDYQSVVYGSYKKPLFKLPENFTFFEINKYEYPQDKWSNGLMRMLDRSSDEFIVLMLEDYWLTRMVDVRAVAKLHEWMKTHQDILRFDLTDDRQYNGKAQFSGYVGEYDILETPYKSEYNMSFQAGIWNTKLLASLLEEGKSPWEVEIHTQPPEEMKIYGTRQKPMNYANAVLKGELDNSQLDKLRPEDREKVTEWVPKRFQIEK